MDSPCSVGSPLADVFSAKQVRVMVTPFETVVLYIIITFSALYVKNDKKLTNLPIIHKIIRKCTQLCNKKFINYCIYPTFVVK